MYVTIFYSTMSSALCSGCVTTESRLHSAGNVVDEACLMSFSSAAIPSIFRRTILNERHLQLREFDFVLGMKDCSVGVTTPLHPSTFGCTTLAYYYVLKHFAQSLRDVTEDLVIVRATGAIYHRSQL